MLKTHDWSNKTKYYTLDDGRIVTRKELAEMTGLSDKTIWIRLKTTRDYEKLSKPKRKVGKSKPKRATTKVSKGRVRNTRSMSATRRVKSGRKARR